MRSALVFVLLACSASAETKFAIVGNPAGRNVKAYQAVLGAVELQHTVVSPQQDLDDYSGLVIPAASVAGLDGLALQHVLLLVQQGALLVTAQQSGAHKPAVNSFRLALERIAILPDQVTHVAFGDRYDLSTARDSGMQVVFVNRNKKKIPFCADAEINTLTELPGLFE